MTKSRTAALTRNPTADAGGFSVDQAIARARQGRVNVTPARAVEMAGKLYLERKFEQAEKVCRQTIRARPDNADAHNILGVALNALGRPDDAVGMLERAIKLAPEAASYHANLGEVLRLQGRLDDARSALSAAIELDPRNAQALNNFGIVEYESGDYQSAAQHYRRALEVRPDMAEASNNLGNALRLLGDFDDAVKAYEDALEKREIYPEAYNNLGTLLQQNQRHEEAEHALKKAIIQNPRYAEAHNNLAAFYFAQKREVDALRVLSDALKFAPDNPQTLLLTARIQMRRSNYGAAEQAVRLSLKAEPDNVEALTLLGQLLHETDRFEESMEALESALDLRPDCAEALNFYGVALKSVGRLDEARESILRSLELNGAMYGAYANLNDLIDFSMHPELFERMDAIFASANDAKAEQFLPLHFAYAKALEDRGEHRRALRHYIIGGQMKRAQLDYDERETFAFFDGIREAFTKELFLHRKYEGLADDRPVFIIGMPRSGSTLVEQILSTHPDVHGAGEVKYLSRAIGQLRDRFPSLPKYPQMTGRLSRAQLAILATNYLDALAAGAGGAKRITDKLLTNYFFAGLIHLLYPRARFIHTVRNPVDTCLSGFTKLFKDDMPHSYRLGELGRYYRKYEELMEHWRAILPESVLHTVEYEAVVADTEAEARKLVEFVGLDWDPRCLEFHKSGRPVKTASVTQVRKPIYATAVERWKKYGKGLKPLVEALEWQAGRDRSAAGQP